jgi:hypothetical protein
MLPGNPVLSECQALSTIWLGSPQWYQTGVLNSFNFIFENKKKSQGAKSPVMTLDKKVSSSEAS